MPSTEQGEKAMPTGLREHLRLLLVEPLQRCEPAFQRYLANAKPDPATAARRAVLEVAGTVLGALKTLDVPTPSTQIPVPDVAALGKAMYSAGHIGVQTWTMVIPSDLAMVACGPPANWPAHLRKENPVALRRYILALYADTLSHECRHCEQIHRVAQFGLLQALESGGAAEASGLDRLKFFMTDDRLVKIYAEKFMTSGKPGLKRPIAPPETKKVVLRAMMDVSSGKTGGSLAKGGEARGEAFKWYHSMYGDTSPTSSVWRKGDNLGNYRKIPEEEDAYACGEMVRDCLLDEWQLGATSIDLRVQHQYLTTQ
jgi:hypothetical protein